MKLAAPTLLALLLAFTTATALPQDLDDGPNSSPASPYNLLESRKACSNQRTKEDVCEGHFLHKRHSGHNW